MDTELAGRGHRLGAAIIDAMIGFIYIIPIFYVSGIGAYVLKGQEPPYVLLLGWGALGFAAFALVHGYFLKNNGQTIGKKIVGIRIVDLDDKVPGLATLLGRRYLSIFLFSLVPAVGGLLTLIDQLFIFRSDRRCVHDLIAKTRVVLSGAKWSSLTWFVIPLIFWIIAITVLVVAVAIPAYKDYQHRSQEAKAKVVPRSPAIPATPPIASDVARTSQSIVADKTTSGSAVAAPEPEKLAPAAPVQIYPPSSPPAAAVSEPKTLAILPSDKEVAAKPSATRSKWHKPADLRYCLNLPSYQEIAKCTGED